MPIPFLNFQHLYYFWMVAREGGISHASEVLDLSSSKISARRSASWRNPSRRSYSGGWDGISGDASRQKRQAISSLLTKLSNRTPQPCADWLKELAGIVSDRAGLGSEVI